MERVDSHVSIEASSPASSSQYVPIITKKDKDEDKPFEFKSAFIADPEKLERYSKLAKIAKTTKSHTEQYVDRDLASDNQIFCVEYKEA